MCISVIGLVRQWLLPFALIWMSTLLGGCVSRPQLNSARTVIKAVTVIPMDAPRSIPNQDVVIAGGRIVAMGPSGSVQTGSADRVIDGAGKFLTPGLWDMHVHATRPTDQSPTTSVLPLYLSYGIVGVRDMGATIGELNVVRNVVAANADLPDVVAAGPVFDGPKRPYQPDVAWPLPDGDAAREAVQILSRAGVDFVKIYDSLSALQYAAIVDEARKLGLPVVGHIPKSMTIEQVSQSGQRSVEHISLKLIEGCVADGGEALPAMLQAWIKGGYAGKYKAIHEWASKRDKPQCSALYARVAHRGTFITPTLSLELIGAGWTTPDDFADMSPSGKAGCAAVAQQIDAAPADARNAAMNDLLEIAGALHRAGVPFLAGTDASNGCVPHGRSLHKELRLLHLAGLSNFEALQSATSNAASFLGRSDEGVVRIGAKANLLLLEADPLADIANNSRIAGVLKIGKWYDPGALHALRKSAAP